MSMMSAAWQAARNEGARDVVRTITLAGLITVTASAYDFVSSQPLAVSLFTHFVSFAFIASLLTAVVIASWLGLIASTRITIGLIYGLIALYLLTVVANFLFVVEAPHKVMRYTPWIVVTLIIPFLTVNRQFARMLGGAFVTSMLLLIAVHVLRIGANPFTQPCCADLILFALALIVAYVLLDGFAMFREAAIKFHAQADALEAHASEMQCALDDADRARNESEIAREEAEKSIKLRETFLATMSHELRTPLNAIIGFSEIMKSDALGSNAAEQYRGYATDIHQSGEHVLGLINQLLEYSRIRSGTFDLSPSPLRLEEIVSFIHRMSLGTAQAKGVELQIEGCDDEEIWVQADRQGLIQIGLNLVGNALKFTDPGGIVTLKVTSDNKGCVTFAVTDTGTGIPEGKLEEVLQPFVRLGDASLASETGTGLGLAIVTALADAMALPFSLKSCVGEGTSASLSMPILRNPGQKASPLKDAAE
jgi:two-component system, cell cycle sensor histidine kinase PleC